MVVLDHVPKKYVITGVAGFIGSHLCERLLRDDHEVVGIDCFGTNYSRDLKASNIALSLENSRFRFAEISLCEDDIKSEIRGADAIFHLAGEPGVRPSWGADFRKYAENNVLATQRLLESMVESDVERIVYASSSSIYGDAETMPTPETATPRPISPYGASKLAGEVLCDTYARSRDLDVRTVRYFTVFGPRQRPDMAFNIFCRAALTGQRCTIFGDGYQSRDFTYVDDAIEATYTAANIDSSDDQVFNIGGGLMANLRDVVSAIEIASGQTLDVEFGTKQLGDVRDTIADITRAEQRLGFFPSTTLQDGIASELAWLAMVTGKDEAYG